jgi:hypothetical protein
VNEGNAMNLQTGKFTAPQPGIYFFLFTGNAEFQASTSINVNFGVGLYLNGGLIGTGRVEESNNVDDQRMKSHLFTYLLIPTTKSVRVEREKRKLN